MNWFQVLAKAHQGYPQPENGYKAITYANCCPRCGIHDGQIAPFRFQTNFLARHTFHQLNWVFDALFVNGDLANDLEEAKIRGVSFGPILDGRTKSVLPDRGQLLFSEVIPVAETSLLPTVTCRPQNEEAATLVEKGRSAFLSRMQEKYGDAPYCGRIKYHSPTKLALHEDKVVGAPDLFQTAEWFGSGAGAFRLTIASERFVELVNRRRWDGLEFRKTQLNGLSERL